MRLFSGRWPGGLLRNTGWVKLGLLCLACWMVNAVQAQPANNNFASATVISGTSGGIAGSNVLATLQPPCETNQIYVDDYMQVEPVGASVWYAWTAPATGTASFNTIGSGFDTILSVWTTTGGLCSPSLTNIVADDDSGGNSTSALSFPAVAGTTYFICVEGYDYGYPGPPAPSTGNVVLNWGENYPTVSSGYFTFASSQSDAGGTPLFVASEYDSTYGVQESLLGARVTVTRTNDYNGRVLVDYATSSLTYTNTYRTSYYGTNIVTTFVNTNGTFITNITFTTIYLSNTFGSYNLGYQTYSTTNAFTNVVTVITVLDTNGNLVAPPITIIGPTLTLQPVPTNPPPFNFTSNTNYFDPLPPFNSVTNTTVITVDTNGNTFNQTLTVTTNVFELPSVMTNVIVSSGGAIGPASGTLAFDDFQMSQDIIVPVILDPGPLGDYAPSLDTITLSNPRLDPLESADLIQPAILQNTAYINALSPNFPSGGPAVLNFQRSTYRVNENVGLGIPNATNISVTVIRTGATCNGVSVNYRIDSKNAPPPNEYDTFPLQAGSDYAIPNVDFVSVTGTLTFAPGVTSVSFAIPIINDNLPEFNGDMYVELVKGGGSPMVTAPCPVDPGVMIGEIDHTIVTILNDDQTAGAVDRTWNKNDTRDSNPPGLMYPGTSGNGGTVYAEAEQPDGKLIIAGAFTSFDSHQYYGIVRALANGYQDPTFQGYFAPWYNSGANDFIAALALQPDGKIIIGGNFTAFNGYNLFHIARLNSDGSVDTTFNPGLGANGMVWAVCLESDGRILIGGEFTSYNGVLRNYLARLNADGSLDTGFDPGVSVNGPIYTLAVPSSSSLNISRSTDGGELEDVNPVNVGAPAGILNVHWDFKIQKDDMKVFYGDTNVTRGTGVLIFDSGETNNPVDPVTQQYIWLDFTIPFYPTNGLTTNVITIVMNQGNGEPGTLWYYTASVTTLATAQVYAGGAFDKADGVNSGGVVRFKGDGSLDTAFAPGIGTFNPVTKTNDPVYALAVQSDGQLLIAGGFSYLDLVSYNGICRLNRDGTVDLSFSPGAGTFNPLTDISDTIYAMLLQPDGEILIGGDFTTYNQTRRVGLARLYADGSLDTSFMDTAYNQFAGLINHYHNPDAVNTNLYPATNERNFVYALAQEWFTNFVTTEFLVTNNGVVSTNFVTTANVTGGNVLIGGNFLAAGGDYPGEEYNNGQLDNASSSTSIYRRDAVLPRSNVARLIGPFTPGPGNIAFSYNNYTVAKDANYVYVSLVRNLTNNSERINNGFTGPDLFTNNSLGIAQVTVSVSSPAAGPGVAVSNVDYSLSPAYSTPTWETAWATIPATAYGWKYSQGVWGPNYETFPWVYTYADVFVNVFNDGKITGNLNANLKLSNPASAFSLGGEVIPLGVALGVNALAPMTILEANYNAGVLGFSSPNFTVVENAGYATITVTRTNGTQNVVQVSYATSNGTATNGINFTNVTGTLTFNNGDTSKTFTVPIIPGTMLQPDKTVNLSLYTPTGGAKLGLTNAVLTIVNNNFPGGHISFTSRNFSTNETSGAALVSLSRLGGSAGTMSVTLFTSGGSGVPGVDYSPYSNTITWNNKIAFTTNIAIPVFHNALVTSNRTVNLVLTNLTLNTAPTNTWGLITNATLTINNVDSVGTVQFSAPIYGVKKYAGYALIPVVRPGGSAGTVTVSYRTLNGTAFAGTNYIATSGVLTFTNGQIGQMIRVPVIDTGVSNGLTALTLVLSNAQPAYALGSPSNATLNIIDIIDIGSVNETPGSGDVTYDAMGMNDTVYAMALQKNNQLVVGGDFTMANGVPRQRIARLNSDGSVDPGFSLPSSAYGANDSVRTIAVQADGRILVGGFFTNFNSVNLSHIARLNSDGSLDSQFAPGAGADNAVYALAQTFVNGASKVLVGGAFATIGGYPINRIAQLNGDNFNGAQPGSLDTAFSPGLGPNGTVYAIAVQGDGRIVIGGDFTSVSGNTNFNHIARLNVDGSVDPAFNPGVGASDPVHAIAIQSDGRILIGGYFTNVNGAALNHIARLNTDGSVDGAFQPGLGASDAVFSIALQADGRIVLGGEFTECSGVTRNRVTRLNSDGTVDPTINFGTGANNFVAAIAVQEDAIYGYPTNVPDEKIIIGGGFTQYNGQPHAYLARIYGGSIGGVGAFEFSSANYQVDENGTNVVITIFRTHGTSGTNADASGDIIVPFTTSDGTARSDVDHASVTNYIAVTNNLDFPEGEVIQTVTIPVLDDGVITPDLTVNLALNPDPPAAFGDQPTATLTIINDDNAVSFSNATYTVSKNAVNGAATINIVRVGSVSGTSTVSFSTTTNGTATAGMDYYPTNVFVTFNPGVSNVSVTVPIINNNVAEGNTTVGLQLTNAVGSLLYSPSNAVLTIIDTVHSPGQLSFSATNYVINEGGGVGYTNAYITVLRSFGSLGAVSATFSTLDGTAAAGVKYVSTNGVVAFGDGETTPKTFAVQVRNTTTGEGTEYLNLLLTNATGGATLVAPTNATLTILNTNTGISFVSATNTFLETGGVVFDGIPNTVLISVQRFNNTNGAATVSFATTDGTAKSNVNYRAASGTLTFYPGQFLATIPVVLIDDTNVTGDLAFTLSLSNPNPGALLVPPFQTTIVVQDADAGISFTNAATSVLKNAGSALITVVCSNPAIEPVIVDSNTVPLEVNYFTSDGTALAGQDYLATSGTLVFVNGIATNTFTVPILNNSSVTGDKTFTVTLTNVTAPGELVTPYVQTVTIVDDNSGLEFSNPAYSVLKTQGTASINVLRTGYTNSVVSVQYIATNGTAIVGQDFTPSTGVLMFTNGVTSQSFNVQIINSSAVRPDVTVLLQLLNPVNAILLPPNAATLTIHDNTGSYVVPAGSLIVSNWTSLFDYTNSIIGTNDTVTVLFAFRDAGGTNVADLKATLLATNGVTPNGPSTQDYGPLVYLGHSVSRPFTFTASGTNGQQIAATFTLTNGTSNIGKAVFGFTLGRWVVTYSNTAPIYIPYLNSPNGAGPASPYPSIINVSGLSGTVVKTALTLTNISHTAPVDIDALLVAPNQFDTLFMAHAGGVNAINHATLKFDDAATNSLPQFGQITNGVYRPTGYQPVPNFP
ncbi:MAG: Calx-beta domain-containing protein [Verrucomicrobiota bacterium]